jgi:hypothetical protein
MAAGLEQDAKRRTEKKPALFMENTQPRSNLDARLQEFSAEIEDAKRLGEELHSKLAAIAQERSTEKARGAALWDEAVESLGRSAGVLAELAESTGEAIARIAARGDRIDRTQKVTRALLTALVASEAGA